MTRLRNWFDRSRRRPGRLLRLVGWMPLLAAVGVVAAGYGLLWDVHRPSAWLLLSHGVVFAAGLRVRDRRRAALAAVAEWHGEEIDAIKLADTRRDSGGHKRVELFDQDDPATLPRVAPDPWQPAAKGRWMS